LKKLSFLILLTFQARPLEADWKDIALSFLLPGYGEIKQGAKLRGYSYIGIESFLMLGWAGFTVHGRSVEKDYIAFAYSNAGANPWREDEEYWLAVEQYISHEKYLEYLRREARQLFPDSPEAQKRWVDEHDVGGEWKWKSKKEWFLFQDIRKEARTSFQKAKICFVFLLANHIASGVDAFITERLKRRGISFLPDIRIEPHCLTLQLKRNF